MLINRLFLISSVMLLFAFSLTANGEAEVSDNNISYLAKGQKSDNVFFPSEKHGIDRYAFIVGTNDGGYGKSILRYAEKDARDFKTLLRNYGGLKEENILFLSRPNKREVEESINTLIRIFKEKNENSDLIFYFSGHSEKEGILLGSEVYLFKDLVKDLKKIPTTFQTVFIDACYAGMILNSNGKGGVKRPPIDIKVPEIKGYVYITSSSPEEPSFETDDLKSSIFTYYLLKGLRGAADYNRNGYISIDEIYQYAYYEMSGTSSPHKKIDYTGKGEVILTNVRKNSIKIVFGKNLSGSIIIKNKDNVVFLKTTKQKEFEESVYLPRGKYELFVMNNNKEYTREFELITEFKIMSLNEMIEVENGVYRSKGSSSSRSFGLLVGPSIPFNNNSAFKTGIGTLGFLYNRILSKPIELSAGLTTGISFQDSNNYYGEPSFFYNIPFTPGLRIAHNFYFMNISYELFGGLVYIVQKFPDIAEKEYGQGLLPIFGGTIGVDIPIGFDFHLEIKNRIFFILKSKNWIKPIYSGFIPGFTIYKSIYDYN